LRISEVDFINLWSEVIFLLNVSQFAVRHALVASFKIKKLDKCPFKTYYIY
jgi:hypothetical protein